eukprot:TRINITY_DN2557_c0_g1_i1.p1 TRINITY_DN2557_c0_g1~~TRINITY_DN2557_c0_g1_i1.p1  ORF type:complete len:1020 (+),score=285.08 TRINITY_DN2557_c0_g1_i1:66-3125(+)
MTEFCTIQPGHGNHCVRQLGIDFVPRRGQGGGPYGKPTHLNSMQDLINPRSDAKVKPEGKRFSSLKENNGHAMQRSLSCDVAPQQPGGNTLSAEKNSRRHVATPRRVTPAPKTTSTELQSMVVNACRTAGSADLIGRAGTAAAQRLLARRRKWRSTSPPSPLFSAKQSLHAASSLSSSASLPLEQDGSAEGLTKVALANLGNDANATARSLPADELSAATTASTEVTSARHTLLDDLFLQVGSGSEEASGRHAELLSGQSLSPADAAAVLGPNAAQKVAALINELEAEVLADREQAQQQWESFSGWCKQSSQALQKEVEASRQQIEELTSTVRQASAALGPLSEELLRQEAGRSAKEADLRAAVSVREKEGADIAADEQRLSRCVNSLVRCIVLLARETRRTGTGESPAGSSSSSSSSSLEELQKATTVQEMLEMMATTSMLRVEDAAELTAVANVGTPVAASANIPVGGSGFLDDDAQDNIFGRQRSKTSGGLMDLPRPLSPALSDDISDFVETPRSDRGGAVGSAPISPSRLRSLGVDASLHGHEGSPSHRRLAASDSTLTFNEGQQGQQQRRKSIGADSMLSVNIPGGPGRQRNGAESAERLRKMGGDKIVDALEGLLDKVRGMQERALRKDSSARHICEIVQKSLGSKIKGFDEEISRLRSTRAAHREAKEVAERQLQIVSKTLEDGIAMVVQLQRDHGARADKVEAEDRNRDEELKLLGSTRDLLWERCGSALMLEQKRCVAAAEQEMHIYEVQEMQRRRSLDRGGTPESQTEARDTGQPGGASSFGLSSSPTVSQGSLSTRGDLREAAIEPSVAASLGASFLQRSAATNEPRPRSPPGFGLRSSASASVAKAKRSPTRRQLPQPQTAPSEAMARLAKRDYFLSTASAIAPTMREVSPARAPSPLGAFVPGARRSAPRLATSPKAAAKAARSPTRHPVAVASAPRAAAPQGEAAWLTPRQPSAASSRPAAQPSKAPPPSAVGKGPAPPPKPAGQRGLALLLAACRTSAKMGDGP